MASETEIENDPNFAIICSFLHNYGHILQFPDISFKALKTYLKSSNNKVHRILEDIFIRLLRRWKGRCPVNSWEKVLITFCYTYSEMDAWELEKFGFPRCSVHNKMRMLKNLLETQFDCFTKFKERLNGKEAEELRLKPLGRDKCGLAYWVFLDKESNVRIYTEEQDDTDQSESWLMVVRNTKGVASLIDSLEVTKDQPTEEAASSVGSSSATPVPPELSQGCVDVKNADSDKENSRVKTNEEKESCEDQQDQCDNQPGKLEEGKNVKIEDKGSSDCENNQTNDEFVSKSNQSPEHEVKLKAEKNIKIEISSIKTVISDESCAKHLSNTSEHQNNTNEKSIQQKVKLDILDVKKESEESEKDSGLMQNKEDTVSKCEDTVSKCEDTMSKCEDTVSKCEDTVSKCEDIVSKCEDTVSKCGRDCKTSAVVEEVVKEEADSNNATDAAVDKLKNTNKSGAKISSRQRKRKRGKAESESEQELSTGENHAKSGNKSESEISETPGHSGNESKEECSPTKRRRDKFLKKRKPIKADVPSESTDESEEPEKKPKTTQNNKKVEKNTEYDSPPRDALISNKKKGKRKEDDKEENEVEGEAPTSKKGRQTQAQEQPEENDAPSMNLRRSARVTRNVNRLEYSTTNRTIRKKQEENAKPVKEQKEEKSERKKQKNKLNSKEKQHVVEIDKKSTKKNSRKLKRNHSEDEDDDEIFQEDEDSEPLHWSSPSATEYEFDSSGEDFQPTGKNAKRQEARLKKKNLDNDDKEEDMACCRCGKSDFPDMMLLCDTCDAGYHTGCLRPPLMLIPHGDWFCPLCEHIKLIENLKGKLKEIEGNSRGDDRLQRRKQRLKYVGISLDNILHESSNKKKGVIRSDSGSDSSEVYDNGEWETLKDKEQREKSERQRDIQQKYYYDWGNRYAEVQPSSEETVSESSSSEEEYSMVANRSRRQRKEINYNFNEYDQIITKAIHDEQQCPAGGGGKSIKTILAASSATSGDKTAPSGGKGAPSGGKGSEDKPAEKRRFSDESSTGSSSEEEEAGKGCGKDMANIEAALAKEKRQEQKLAAKNNIHKETSDTDQCKEEDIYANKPSPPMQKAKATRKKSKRLTALSDNEDYEDESEEYKASDDDNFSDEDNYSEDVSDESYGRGRHSSKKSLRRSARRRRVLRDSMKDFVVDEYDSEEEVASVRRSGRKTRGAASRSRHNALSDEEEGDSEFYSQSDDSTDRRKTKPSKSNSKRKRKIRVSEESENGSEAEVSSRRKKSSTKYEEDSDFSPSDENLPRSKRSAKSKRINYREVVGSESELDSPNKKKKSKIDVNKFVKGADSNTDEYSHEQASEDSESEGSVKASARKSRIKYVSESSDEDALSNPETETQAQEGNPGAKQQTTFLFKPKMNGNAQVDTLISELPTNIKADILETGSETSESGKKDVDDSDDDLEGIGDIIEYITNE